jgi:PAS domain S-box-containing protein
MDSLLDILMTTDPSGVITEVNRATEHMSGFSKEELIGQPFRKFFTDPDRAQAGIEKVLAEGGVSNYDLTVATKDGREIPVSYNATVLRDPDGQITGVLGSARDMTELKLAEEKTRLAVAELDQIINTAVDGIRVIDKDFNTIRVNDTYCTISGASRDDSLSKKCHETFHSSVCHTPDCFLTRILGGETHIEQEVEKERADGTMIACILTATPFMGSNGELIGIIEDYRDITDRRKTADDLKHSVQDLSRSLW